MKKMSDIGIRDSKIPQEKCKSRFIRQKRGQNILSAYPLLSCSSLAPIKVPTGGAIEEQ